MEKSANNHAGKKINSGFAHLALIVIVVIAIGVVGNFMLQGRQISQQQNTTSETETANTPPTPDPNTANWKIYTNKGLGVVFSYPPNFQVQKHS